MLEKLKRFFFKTEKRMDAETDSYNPEPSGNPNFLTDSDKILKLLKNIEEASPLCNIIVDGTEEEFNSSILDVQTESRQIVLDELLPKHGNELLKNTRSIKLSTIFNGIHLAFKLDNISISSAKGIAYYKADIPHRIYYPQRRNAPRISINSLNIAFSGTSNRTKASVGGYLFDLSRSGIGIICPNRPRVQRGDAITNCRMTLDDNLINFDLSVRFLKTQNQASGKTQLGGYFENISPQSKKKLENFFSSLEREEIRKRRE